MSAIDINGTIVFSNQIQIKSRKSAIQQGNDVVLNPTCSYDSMQMLRLSIYDSVVKLFLFFTYFDNFKRQFYGWNGRSQVAWRWRSRKIGVCGPVLCRRELFRGPPSSWIHPRNGFDNYSINHMFHNVFWTLHFGTGKCLKNLVHSDLNTKKIDFFI